MSKKAMVVPLRHWGWNHEIQRPIPIMHDVTVERVSGLFKPENFQLWKDYVSENERDDLAETKVALVHRFNSDFHLSEPEKLSETLTHRIFVCLRIIKPTRELFQTIHVKWISDTEIEVAGFSNRNFQFANVPDAEVLNTVDERDLALTSNVLVPFLHAVEDGPELLRRAIGCHEKGYAETQDPVLQLIMWTMGIESVLAVAGVGYENAKQEILHRLGDENIYSEASPNYHKAWPQVSLSSVVGDMFDLRDIFVHGRWIPDKWKQKYRESVAGQALSYADVLRDVAPFILRRLIRQALQTVSY
jgi:hypothetical protein